MRPQDIKLGETYRHRSTPNYCYAKVVQILKAREAPNTHTYVIVKCEWTIEKTGDFGLIKYFRPCDLERLAGEAGGRGE